MKNKKEIESLIEDSVGLDLFGPEWIKTYIEGILFISDEPVKVRIISEALGVDKKTVKKVLDELENEYIEQNRGFVIKKISGGYRFYSNPAISEALQKFVKTNIKVHLSQAAFETLAIAAYKQPVTRTQIAEIRGVRTDSVVVTLVEKGLLKEAGKLKELGAPILYRTTEKFLELMVLNSIKDLPPLKDFNYEELPKED